LYVSLIGCILWDICFLENFFFEKEIVILSWAFFLRNFQISECFLLEIYLDPDTEWFFPGDPYPDPDPAKSFVSDRIRIHNTVLDSTNLYILSHFGVDPAVAMVLLPNGLSANARNGAFHS
jgi:hypothetical protein